MTRTPEEIADLYFSRRKYYDILQRAMYEVRDIYDDRVEVPLSDFDKSVRSSVPNLLAQGVDQYAGRIASVTPSVVFAANHPGQRNSERQADKARRVLGGWWQLDRTGVKQRQRARHLIAYGMSPVVIAWDHKHNRPTRRVRDPIGCYPSPEVLDGTEIPVDVLFAYRRSVGWLKAMGWDAQVRMVLGQRHNATDDMMLTLVEYIDTDCTVLTLVATNNSDNEVQRIQQIWIPPQYSTNHGTARVAVLAYTPSPAPDVPMVSIPSRITLGGPQGQFDSMVGMYYHQVKLMALELIATEKAVFPDTYLISRPGEVARLAAGPFDGRTGQMNEVVGGDIKEMSTNPGPMTGQILDRLERAERMNAGIPSEFGGESGSNIRTGRRGDQVLSGIIDFPVGEAQELFAYALAEENRAMIALDKAHSGESSKTIYVGAGNQMQSVTYKPAEVFTHDEHVVYFPVNGADQNSLMIGIGQRLGIGTMSKLTGAQMDPLISNPEWEHQRIIVEGLEESLVTGIQQKVASGDPAYPPVMIAKISALMLSDKLTLADALTQVANEAAAAAHEQTQAPPGAEPGGPPTADSLAAGPTAQALTGSPIPGPSQGMTDLSSLMNNLRKPVRTVVPEANVPAGGM